MPDTISIGPANLLLDENNPRLSEPNSGQRETLRYIAKTQNRKLLNLAKDILQNGLDPSTLLMVVPHTEEGRYTAVEGNRRLAAMKALENPEAVNGAVDASVLNELRELNRQYQSSPIELVPCIRFKNADEAAHWIKLRHTGENDGAGIVRWGSDEQTRFDKRGKKPQIHTQALDYLEKIGLLTRERRAQIPTASLKRMLESPPIRSKLGVGVEDGTMTFLGDPARVAKALLYVIDELVGGKTKTEHIYTKEDREEYASSLPKTVVVPLSTKPLFVDDVPAPKKPVTKPKSRVIKPRLALIPNDCILKVTDPRVRQITLELRALHIDDYENATAVLLRVFAELSVDAYMDKKGLPWTMETKLSQKFDAVLSDLLKDTKISKQQAVPVRKAMQKESFLTPSIYLLNQYVHNKHVFPTAKELRSFWDSLQPFFVAIWS